jgi:putative transcriptional regulator
LKALQTAANVPVSDGAGRSPMTTQPLGGWEESRDQHVYGVDRSPETGRTAVFTVDIRESRLKLGWSLQRLAHEVGVSQSTLHRWEHRHTKPSSLAIRQLERILDRVAQH